MAKFGSLDAGTAQACSGLRLEFSPMASRDFFTAVGQRVTTSLRTQRILLPARSRSGTLLLHRTSHLTPYTLAGNSNLSVLTSMLELESNMTKIKMQFSCALLVTILLSTSPLTAAEKLSDILRNLQWDGIIGTWVDAETNGQVAKVTYSWKIKDRVIEVTSKGNELETVALMGVNAKNGEVFHLGADSAGGSSLGKWELADNGDAVLELLFTGGDGEQGVMTIRHHREDKDTIIVTFELPDPIKFKMIRAKDEAQK